MGVRRVLPLVSCVLLAASSVLAGAQPLTVSPGDSSKLVVVESHCPTFSWGQVEGARGYELVVYRLEMEGEEAQPVLRQRVPGSASSWTPSLDRCLERGGRYAWSVRTVAGRQASDWSAPSLFQVEARPGRAEFEQALAVVRQYLAARDSVDATSAEPLATDESVTQPEASARRDSPASPVPPTTVSLVTEGAAGLGTSNPQDNLHVHSSDSRVGLLVTPTGPLNGFGGDSEILLSEDPYGSLGMKLQYDGDGNYLKIFGQNTNAGELGPWLTIARESGGVYVNNTLHVGGLECTGCVQTSQLADLSVNGSKLGNSSVVPAKLAPLSVENSKLATGAVTSSKILDGSITGDDLKLTFEESNAIAAPATGCLNGVKCCSGSKKVLSGGTFDVLPLSPILVQSGPRDSGECWEVFMCATGEAYSFKLRVLCVG